MALSPDDSLLAFVAGSDRKPPRIYLRSLDRWDPVRLADDIAWMPFFSPDGQWLGAISRVNGSKFGGQLKKYPVNGGAPTTICDCPWAFGASWASDGTIVAACEYTGGLWRVSAQGGVPEQITELDQEAEEISHRLPHLIPGANAVLFTVLRQSLMADFRNRDVIVQSLETGERKILIKEGADARYVLPGYLVFVREGTLWAVPFDRDSLAVTGPEFPVLDGVSQALYTNTGPLETGAAQFAVSNSGSLAYIGGAVVPERKKEVVWVDRNNGEVEPIGIEPAQYHTVRVSPDSSTVALDTSYKRPQVWTYDLERHAQIIQTPEGRNSTPIWSPDGATLVFGSEQRGTHNLFSKVVDGDDDPQRLSPSPRTQYVGSWSPDGTKLAFTQVTPGSQHGHDIWILSMDGSGFAEPFLENSKFQEMSPEFSPNGRWLAYTSGESGPDEVYVQRYPQKGGKVTISNAGGESPVWSGRGDELFYLTRSGRSTKYWGVDINIRGDTLTPGNPVFLFEKECVRTQPVRSYDVAPDGQRFLMILNNNAKERRAMWGEYFGKKVKIVLNWSEELSRREPVEQ